MEETKNLVLRKPISIGEGEKAMTYDVLTLREPTAIELDKATREPTQVATAITLIQLVAKVPRQVVEQMGQRDLEEATDFLGSFSATNGPVTGETSSQI